jgi:23S rRNA G2069 N7-methylase RlmK/C1962 C5-methylase RlmI
MVMDFRKLDLPDESFKLVVMDPPHIIHKEDSKMNMVITYGALNKETWKEDIKQGFDEAWRVLENYGILIFKWNETSIKKKEVLEIINKEPLFGHPNGSSVPTHWLCFMKIK